MRCEYYLDFHGMLLVYDRQRFETYGEYLAFLYEDIRARNRLNIVESQIGGLRIKNCNRSLASHRNNKRCFFIFII